MVEHDLVVRGGTVVDGTGGPARTADVAVQDGRVVEVGRVGGRGREELDAAGALVAPGFVDIHTHYDGQATWDSSLAPSAWHGVTTVVTGNCGVGFAPVRPSDHDRLIELMEGVEDIPGVVLHEGLSWAWESFPEFLDEVDARPHDIDVATQVPHGALRLNVMRERGARQEPATPEDIEAMAALAREAVEAGALGFSTSRTLNHRTSTGEHTPTLTAEVDELVGIAAALGQAGTGVLQVVSDFLDFDTELDICRRMMAESGRPMSISVVQSPIIPTLWRDLLDAVSEANADGLRMSAQVAARPVGILNGLQCTLHPLLVNPVHREIAHLPAPEQARIMADPDFKRRVLEAAGGRAPKGALRGRLTGRFEQMYVLGDPPDYEPDPATSVAGQAAREGREPLDLAYDLLMADEGRALLYQPILNFVDGDLDAVGEMLSHPFSLPGLSDGGAHVGTICDGSFPTTLLAHWGRDRRRGRIDLPFLVSRQCRETAQAVGLLDRGVLAPGYRADLNVIDFDALRLRAPVMRFDLPAGGKRLLQKADGYRHTFVAGVETYRDGEATGALPGRLVRGAQRAPMRSDSR